MLRKDVVAVESATLSSVAQVCMSSLDSWNFVGCMVVDEVVEDRLVACSEREDAVQYDSLVNEEVVEVLPMANGWTVLSLVLCTEVVVVVFAAWWRWRCMSRSRVARSAVWKSNWWYIE